MYFLVFYLIKCHVDRVTLEKVQVDSYNEMRDRFERTHRGAEKFPGTTITYTLQKRHVCRRL